jgi:serine/threonine-protein kinase
MDALAPDRRLGGRYVLEELVATGGMATVWRAMDEVLARAVAVKVLRDELAGDVGFLRRFQAEAVAAARLAHPNIIRVFDTGLDDGAHYIVMEYFGGTTLLQLLEQRGRLEPDEAVQVALPTLSALEFAHSCGVLHRDVKPGNILVSSDVWVKVTDFGIAKAAFAGNDLTRTGAVLGTVRYLSPEQVQGSEVDHRSDLYSMGVVLFELLTGRPPFAAETEIATAMMRLTRDPPRPRDIRGGIPRGLEAIVLRAMARRRDDRFTSADAMRTALERYSSAGETTPAGGVRMLPGEEPETPVLPAPQASSVFRAWMLVPLLVVVVAALAIAGGLAFGRLRLGGSLGVRPAPAPKPSVNERPIPVPIAGGSSYDPQGDGAEHPDEVRLAFDRNTGTAWTTDHYSSAHFGNLKQGVGLWLDLGNEARVGRVFVMSPLGGWQFQVQEGTSGRFSSPLADTRGATTFTVGPSGRAIVDLGTVRASGILLWITELAPDSGRYAAAISEIAIQGPS